MQKTVSQEYLIGITEGRSFLNSTPHTLADMHRHIANIATLLSQRPSKEMAEVYRGQRDFWKNQIKKALLPEQRKVA